MLQSYTGRVDTRPDFETIFPFPQPWRYRGRIFLDVFSTITGSKLLTIEGGYAGADGRERMRNTAWIDRYFLIPLGEQMERCLVCDFDNGQKGKKQ
ncbi:MAG: hypothetical protein ACR2NN_27240 [Bryobacteraceae bacterium]